MTCFYPLKAFMPIDGKKPVFNSKFGYKDKPLDLPCGQCIGCRLQRSKNWAIRCLHEAKMHELSSFVTLTYTDDNIPIDENLSVQEHQKFVKKLRKYFEKYHNLKFKFYMCGEYGEKFGRPHYHYCLFGIDFFDKKPYKKNHMGNMIFTSEILNKIWGKGICVIGNVSFESAAYVARYICKKITGKEAEDHYIHLTKHGEVVKRTPEFNIMSRKPGIGKTFYDQFKTDIFPADEVIVKGKQLKPPSYYLKCFQIDDEEGFNQIKLKRKKQALKAALTDDDLAKKAYIQEKKYQLLKRTLK